MKCAKIFEADYATSICESCEKLWDCYLTGDIKAVTECCDYVEEQPVQAWEVENEHRT